MEEPEGLEGLESTLKKLRQDQIGKLICSLQKWCCNREFLCKGLAAILEVKQKSLQHDSDSNFNQVNDS